MLRERRSSTLLIMQDDAIDIEGNMTASGKIKVKKSIQLIKIRRRIKMKLAPLVLGKTLKKLS
jgi:hypothetical protein